MAPSVGGDELADGESDLADMGYVHPSMHKDTQSAVGDFVSELGAWTAFDEMIHSSESEDPA